MAELTIEDYKKQYEAARAAGDAAGMQAANDGANAIRASMGIAPEYATQDIANIAAQSANSTNSAQSTAQTMPAGYTGSAQSVGVNTTDQEAIKAQMNANSQAWYGASAEEQARLHAENEYLATLLGGSVAYDPMTGTWSGEAAASQTPSAGEAAASQVSSAAASLPVPQGSDLSGMVEDYSPYLEQMYAAQKASALAQLQAAYESNVAAIDRAGEGVAEQYQAARNSTAGASELAKRNFAEYAAASGLNSGAGGQAELARNVTLQNNLNSIDTAEADTVADLELQRAQAEIEYNNAIAQAEAEGDYQLASALYQEKVRVQDALIDLQIQQQQMDLQRYQLEYQQQRDQVGDSQWQQQFDEAIKQNDIATALELLSQLGTAQGNVADTLGIAQGTQTAAQQQYTEQFDYQKQRDQVGDSQWQQQFDEAIRENNIATALDLLSQLGIAPGSVADTLGIAEGTQTAAQQQWDQNVLMTVGEYMMSGGAMPTVEQLTAMGATEQQAQQVIANLKAQAASSSGSGSSGSGGTVNSGGADYDSLFAAAYASGYPKSFIANNYKQYGFTSSTGLYDGYQEWQETSAADNGQKLYTNEFSTLVSYAKRVLEARGSADYLYDVLRVQGYGDAVIDQVFAALGL